MRREPVAQLGSDDHAFAGDGGDGGSIRRPTANEPLARRRKNLKSASDGAAAVLNGYVGQMPVGRRTKSELVVRSGSDSRSNCGDEGAAQDPHGIPHKDGRPTKSKAPSNTNMVAISTVAALGEAPVQDGGHCACGLADLIAEIADTHKRHHFMKRVSGDLSRAFKSKSRAAAVQRVLAEGGRLPEGGKFPPVTKHDEEVTASIYFALITAREATDLQWKAWEKRLNALAKQLPVYSWAKSTKGLGALSLAQIIGETGDLSKYPSCRHVWKRMGLGLVGDKIQRKTTDKAMAIAMGYTPRRRSLMFVVGDNLIRAGNEEYRAIYDARKAYEIERDPKMSKLHAHRRAKRVMEKRLLKDLWRAWRRSTVAVTAEQRSAAADPIPMAAE